MLDTPITAEAGTVTFASPHPALVLRRDVALLRGDRIGDDRRPADRLLDLGVGLVPGPGQHDRLDLSGGRGVEVVTPTGNRACLLQINLASGQSRISRGQPTS